MNFLYFFGYARNCLITGGFQTFEANALNENSFFVGRFLVSKNVIFIGSNVDKFLMLNIMKRNETIID